MDFWSTQLGVRLAEVLIHFLPKIAEKEQYVVTEKNEPNDVLNRINSELKKGSLFVNSVTTGDSVIMVFEK